MKRKGAQEAMDDGDTYDITKCYGVNCLDCSRDCEFREAGLSVIAEKKETVARRFGTGNTVEYDDELLNTALLTNDTEIDDPDFEQGYREGALATVRKLVHFYLEKPLQFDTFVKKFFCGGNQSAMAKAAGVSRQAISKAIRLERCEQLTEKVNRLAERCEVLEGLTPVELRVYQLAFVDGLPLRSVAELAKISLAKAYRVKQDLRSKLPKSETRPIATPEKILEKIKAPAPELTPDLF